jgi:hypothetical protein
VPGRRLWTVESGIEPEQPVARDVRPEVVRIELRMGAAVGQSGAADDLVEADAILDPGVAIDPDVDVEPGKSSGSLGLTIRRASR